jgi:hypothetical protein
MRPKAGFPLPANAVRETGLNNTAGVFFASGLYKLPGMEYN